MIFNSHVLRYLVALSLSLSLIGLTSCGSSDNTAPSPSESPSSSPALTSTPSAPAAVSQAVTVEQVNATGMGGAFSPAQVNIPVGGSVQWINHSGNVHNVTFDDSSIGTSPIMYANATYSKTFTKPGTYHYACTYHPGMEGTVIVG
ncbi:MAG: cupredoxin domain-containing protein [Candidatus Dormibacteraceae bacterium]